MQVAEDVESKAESDINFCLFRVDCSRAINFLKEKAINVRKKIQEKLAQGWNEKNLGMLQKFEALKSRLAQQPDTVEALREIELFLEKSQEELKELKEGIGENQEVFALLQQFQCAIPDESFETFWNLRHWPTQILQTTENTKRTLFKCRTKFMVQLKNDQAELEDNLKQFKVRERHSLSEI